MNRILNAIAISALLAASAPCVCPAGDDQGSDHRNVESCFAEGPNSGPGQVSARGAAAGLRDRHADPDVAAALRFDPKAIFHALDHGPRGIHFLGSVRTRRFDIDDYSIVHID
jgi:hypothetical protein